MELNYIKVYMITKSKLYKQGCYKHKRYMYVCSVLEMSLVNPGTQDSDDDS